MKSGKIIVYIFCIFILTGGFAAAQDGGPVWEGTASMSRYGEFPSTGLYAASNSFPRNTIVEVENLQNGRSATVIIADRLNNPGLFMLLSREAAGTLGITEDETVQVRVSLKSETESVAESLVEERPYSADPDVNPAALAEQYEVPEAEEPLTGMLVEEETPREEPPEIAEDTPRLTTSPDTPALGTPRLPSLDMPAEPAKVETAETEEAAAEQPGKEMPRLSILSESPAYKDLRLPDLAVPSSPPEPGAEGEETVPSRETPEISAIGTSPEIPGLSLASVAVPVEPSEEVPEEPEIENGEARLTYMTNPSPDVDPLVLWDLDIPEEPGRAELAAEDEVPDLTDVAGSPFVEGLQVASLEEPRDPSELGEEDGPEDTTTGLSELLISPDAESLDLDSVEEPMEPVDDEDEAPVVAELETETPEREPDVELAAIDEPEEPSGKESTETVTKTEEGEPSVEIPEDSMLVLEPAEPRPPEDTAPESVEVPETEITEPEEPLIAEDEEESGFETAPAVTAGSLERGAYYVQLGVYSESNNAKLIADKYSTAYPVAVLRETSASKQIYKVLLGPVNYDESGGLLYNFRAKGFKDAFIRKE